MDWKSFIICLHWIRSLMPDISNDQINQLYECWTKRTSIKNMKIVRYCNDIERTLPLFVYQDLVTKYGKRRSRLISWKIQTGHTVKSTSFAVHSENQLLILVFRYAKDLFVEICRLNKESFVLDKLFSTFLFHFWLKPNSLGSGNQSWINWVWFFSY